MRLPPVLRRADGTAAQLMERIRHEGAYRQPFFRELCATSMSELLIALIRRARSVDRDRPYPTDLPHGALADPVALRAVRYLHQHHAQPLTLRGVARVLGVSERHLRASVEQALGESPLRYLAHYRIDRAKDLIAHRDLALKDVAARTGFRTVHHFTRTFTRLAGLPPGAWRRSYADGIRRDVCINPDFVNDVSTVASASGKPVAVSDKDLGRTSL
jgi:AraC-like DNA-binding protein